MPPTSQRYTAAQLASIVGITPRTLRWWIASGIVPPPTSHGRGSAYGEEHLLRARAARALRERKTPLDQIRRKVARANPEALAALARPPDAAPAKPPPPPLTAPSYPHERWQRVELVPGLELHVREDGSGALRRLADEIYRHFGAAPTS